MQPLGCYHLIENGTGRVERGCMAALTNEAQEKCRNSDECKQCFGSKCNYQSSFISCVECNSSDDPDCAENIGSHHTKVCSRYQNSCFTAVGNVSIVRGCFNDMDPQFSDICESNPKLCDICDPTHRGKPCNSQPIKMESCVMCDSRDDWYCREHADTQSTVLCHRFGTLDATPQRSGCYLRTKRHHGQRGCLQDLPQSDQIQCLDQSDTCKSCIGNNCNVKNDFQHCLNCTSLNDPYCTKYLSGGDEEVCGNYMDLCIVGVDGNGVTHRRCASAAADNSAEFVNGWELCGEAYCNDFTLPSDRPTCYQCAGDRFCTGLKTKTPMPLNPKPCNIYSADSQCFTYLDDGKIAKFFVFYQLLQHFSKKKYFQSNSFIVDVQMMAPTFLKPA